MIALLASTLISLSVMNISRFDDVHSLSLNFDRLYVGSSGGIVIYDIVTDEIVATLIGYNVELPTPDPMSNDVYFVAEGGLYRWYPKFSMGVDFIGVVGMPTSLGVGRDSIYLEYNGAFKATSKFIFSLKPSSEPHGTVQWSGAMVEIDRRSDEATFLIPFSEAVPGMGFVHYTVIYRGGGRIWVGTDGDGVREYREFDYGFVKKLKFGIASSDVASIEFDGDTIWLGGYGGITKIYGRNRQFFTPRGTIAMRCDSIVDIVVANDGDVWFATDCNIMHFSSGMFWGYNPLYEPTCIYATDDGLLIGTERGLFELDFQDGTISRKGWNITAPIKAIDGPNNRNLMVLTSFGTYWVDDSGAHRVADPRGWLSGIGMAEEWLADTGFVVTSDGFLIITDSTIDYYDPIFPASRTPVYDIEVTDYRVWFATRDGLFYFDRDTKMWGKFFASSRFPQCQVYAVRARKDTIFVGTAEGLSIITDWRER